MQLKYWIQQADFSATDFEGIDVVGAEMVLRDHDWRSEWAHQALLASEGEDFCKPGVGFVRGEFILHLCPNENRTADCTLFLPISQYALSKAEQHQNVLIVSDPDAVRTIASAPLVLQYRLLQLHFRPDDDALEILFDEYGMPDK
jgi:hypothetical protein